LTGLAAEFCLISPVLVFAFLLGLICTRPLAKFSSSSIDDDKLELLTALKNDIRNHRAMIKNGYSRLLAQVFE